MKFENREQYKSWIEHQNWYQTIELENGLVTPGKFQTQDRVEVLSKIDFSGKRVLDVGCNSGQYCLLAKKSGAREVIGVDVLDKRLEQARVLALNENLDVLFHNKSLFDISELGSFDVVLCIAVLTEITDFVGAIQALKTVIGAYAFLELSLARPLFYVSRSKAWLKGWPGLPRRKAISEFHRTKGGDWTVSPSFEVLQAMFGASYRLRDLGHGVRYDMVDVWRV